MIYNFDTDSRNEALAALLVYGIYRSRDMKRYKVTPDMWGQIERFAKSAAKRSVTLPDFIERLKPRLSCSTLHPRWMKTSGFAAVTMYVDRSTGEVIQPANQGEREFWVRELGEANHRATLKCLYQNTALVIALVRDRLEREKPLEALGLDAVGGQAIEADEMADIAIEEEIIDE